MLLRLGNKGSFSCAQSTKGVVNHIDHSSPSIEEPKCQNEADEIRRAHDGDFGVAPTMTVSV